MNMKEVREMAKRVGAKITNMKKTEAIRAIQMAEGYSDCYGRIPPESCMEMDCLFRADCLAFAASVGK